mgnify:CR=1 FL=1
MKTQNFIIVIFTTLILAVALGYGVFWYVIADRINAEIKTLYETAANAEVVIEGEMPKVSGFPRKHAVTFAGKVQKDGYELDIPSLKISGFPLPGKLVNITLPQGISLSGPDIDSKIWSLDSLSFSGPIPLTFPSSATVEALRVWRDGGGSIDISTYDAQKEALHISGYGQLKLDDALQITGYSNMIARGHIAFLGYLERSKLIDPRQSLITSSVLDSLSSKDEATGERFIKGSLSIQNRELLLGPIQIMTLPVIEWPYEGVPKMDIYSN